jgi:lipoprotein-anchoring transpeptidase ErfK/SrfK
MPYSCEFEEFLRACETTRTKPSEHVILVLAGQSKLLHFARGVLAAKYPVSLGKNGLSCVEDSGGTPTGLHEVCEKIGDGEPIDTVFVGRVSIGKTWRELKTAGEDPAKARVTTRILRLRGLEEGVNAGPGVDSYARYIYIHGTVFEDRIGLPTSAGCITLLNADMLELFDALSEKSLVHIVA